MKPYYDESDIVNFKNHIFDEFDKAIIGNIKNIDTKFGKIINHINKLHTKINILKNINNNNIERRIYERKIIYELNKKISMLEQRSVNLFIIIILCYISYIIMRY